MVSHERAGRLNDLEHVLSANPPPESDYTDWVDLREEIVEQVDPATIDAARHELHAWLRSYKLAEARRRRNMTQAQVAKAMSVTQGRVSQIERGEIHEAEVETLARYVSALGGTLRIVVDFGDDLMQIA
jgi:predicted XRE-type DNA-binding protein